MISLFSRNIFQSIRKTSLIVSAWLCTIGGLVADVLQPIAPFTSYLFFGLLSLLIGLTIIYFLGKKALLGAIVLTAVACVITGSIALMQKGPEAKKKGIIASKVPSVSSWQESLGIIDKKLDKVSKDTEVIKENTARIESKSDEMLTALDSIKEEINNSSDGGLIRKPKSPEDHYHNARIQELGGDYSAARRSYLEYFKNDTAQLDPHLRFISFLKVQEGTAGARETYNEVTAALSSETATYARILLQNTQKRKASLSAYLNQNPEFAPAAYHLSKEYSSARLGLQTLADKRNELAALKAFQSIDEKGGLLRHFIDQEQVEEWRTDAAERKASIESETALETLENPVSINWQANNQGWNANVNIAEPVLDIKWSIKGETEPQSVGFSGYNDPSTGSPAPLSFFSFPKNQADSVFEIRYTDGSGVEQGPYRFKFTAQKESNDGNRKMLEMTQSNWVSFSDDPSVNFLYFTHLLSYRGALTKIEYGLNQNEPSKSFDFPLWDKPGIALIDGSFPIFLAIPKHTQFVSIRLSYKNGDVSPIARFNRNER